MLLLDSLEKRVSVTSIYYLLVGNNFSAFHRLDADESWHYYEGNSELLIHIIDNTGDYKKIILGTKNSHYQTTVPANQWFAANLEKNTTLDYAFVGCTVSPGFEFKHFELADQESLKKGYPNHQKIIEQLTRP